MCASSCIKHDVQPSYGCREMPVVARMCVYTVRNNYLIHNIYFTKSTETSTKNIFLNEQNVGMLLQNRTDTRRVVISSMRKPIYVPPYNNTY